MFTTLRSRLWLTYALIIGLLIGVLGFTMLVYLARNPLQERQTIFRLAVTADSITRLGEINPREIPLPRLSEMIHRVGERSGLRITLLGPTGQILADSQEGTAPDLAFNPRLLNQDQGLVTDISGGTWLYARRPLGESQSLAVSTERPRPFISALSVLSDELLPPFVQAALLALVLALILAALMARWISAPLQRMARGAQSVASGEYRPIPLEGPREVQALARSFNEMSQRVQASQLSQRDFVANVSHELKTPLTSIQGFAQAIQEGAVEDPAGVKSAAGVIYTEADRMHRLVLDLLDLARLDSGTMDFRREPLDLQALLLGVAEKFQPQAKKAQVELETRLGPLPMIIGDRDRLAQVFTNLVDNAIKYTPQGGRVAIEATQNGDQIQTYVHDSGAGIPVDLLDRIYERFYQLDKARRGDRSRGAGLGLTIAYEIVQAHGGRLSARSTPGQGSSFLVELPTTRPDDTTLASPRKG